MMLRLAGFTLCMLAASPALSGTEVEAGRVLVEANCSRCHAISLTDESKHPDAPAFRTLSQRYPIDTLAEALAEGISVGHPDMPEFLATPSQIDEIIAYLMSLQRP